MHLTTVFVCWGLSAAKTFVSYTQYTEHIMYIHTVFEG